MTQSAISDSEQRRQHPLTRAEVRERLLEIVAGLRPGDRLPPSRMIASELNISLSRVQAATTDLVREGILRTVVGKGTFVCDDARRRNEIRILLGMPLPPAEDPILHSSWSRRIASALLSAGLKHPYTVSWIPFRGNDHSMSIPEVDAAIVLPSQRLPDSVLESLQRNGKQIFSYNPHTFSCTKNFVSPDYFEGSARIGAAFLAAGRRNMVLLVGNRLDRSASNAQRCAGFINSVGPQIGNGVTLRILETGDDYPVQTAVRELMRSTTPPDAIYAFGDPLAYDAIRELQALGFLVPQDVSVVAGSGAGTHGSPILNPTMMVQPYQAIADALLSMVINAINNPGYPQPGTYLPCRFVGGGTTLPRENAILRPA